MDPDAALSELRTLAYVAQTIVDGGEVGDWHATMFERVMRPPRWFIRLLDRLTFSSAWGCLSARGEIGADVDDAM